MIRPVSDLRSWTYIQDRDWRNPSLAPENICLSALVSRNFMEPGTIYFYKGYMVRYMIKREGQWYVFHTGAPLDSEHETIEGWADQ